MARRDPLPHPDDRPLLTAELLSIGSELTVGDTRDTNSGELARSLTGAGVAIGRITALPDRLEAVVEAFTAALSSADLVVSTGGLGPTPDDLTREAISAVCDETPEVDPALERWLRGLWARRRIPFPEGNLKQAWRIPSARALPNPNGTAPGWLVGRPDGRVIVALPGPPREMRPMWHDEVLPHLRARGGGLGTDVAARTYRLTGIGESQVAEIIGDLLRAEDPVVATYARAEAVDVRIAAVGRPGRTAIEAVERASAVVEDRLGGWIWASGEVTWSSAIGDALGAHGWSLAVVERETGGQVGALLGDVPWLRHVEATRIAVAGRSVEERDAGLLDAVRRVRTIAGSDVALGVDAEDRGDDTDVAIAVVSPDGDHLEHRTAFLGGDLGRTRAALAAAAVLHARVRPPRPTGGPSGG